MPLKDYDASFKKASLHQLQKGYVQLCDMEVDLEDKLNYLRDAKARIMIEIDERINKK